MGSRMLNQSETAEIEAVITNQLSLETAIPTSPAPQVTTDVVDVANGYVSTNITYADPNSPEPITLNVRAGQ